MKKNVKGALFSAFIFPGVGQFYIGKKMAGFLFFIAANIGLAGIIYHITVKVKNILVQIGPQLERGEIDFQSLVQISVETSLTAVSLLEKAGYYLIIICWVLSIVHALMTPEKEKG